MRFNQVLPRAVVTLKAGCIPFVLASPGVGKTAMGKKIADDLKWGFMPEEGSQRDTVDVRGLPMVVDGTTTITKPDMIDAMEALFAQGHKDILVMVDEFTSTIRPVMVGFQQMTLEKRIGRHPFPNPEHVHFMLAGNTGKDRTEFHQLTAPMANRCVFFELDPNVDDLVSWGLQNSTLHEVVIGLLRFKGNLIYTFDPSIYGKEGKFAFATPRTWEMASRMLYHGAKADDVAQFAGCIGDGPAAEMAGFWKNFGDLDHPSTILKSPKTAKLPTKASALYALAGSLVTYISDKDQYDPLMTYMERVPKDFQSIIIRDLIAKITSFASSKQFLTWINKNTDFVA